LEAAATPLFLALVSIRALLRGTDVGILDYLRPFCDLGPDIDIQSFGRTLPTGHAEIGEPLLDVALRQRALNLEIEPRAHVTRCPRRRHEREPRRRFEVGDGGLGHGWNFRRRRRAGQRW
jgi:hypothetical protein